MKKKVLLLGATGRIGKGFIEEYLEKYTKYYDLILGVHSKKPKGKLKSIKVDLSDIKSLKKSMSGVSVVVNLAANSDAKAKFEDLVKPNIVGTYNVFEAARIAKVERVIFASSVHAINAYPHGHEVKNKDAPMPLDFYGATKAFGESLCSVFSHKYNLSCLAIRIGAYVSNDQKTMVCYTRKDYDYVISQRDMGQLLHKSILASKKVKYGILSGISDNDHKRMELKFTKKLIGYNPRDDAFKVCRAIKKSGLRK